jgi:hypothetical protein
MLNGDTILTVRVVSITEVDGSASMASPHDCEQGAIVAVGVALGVVTMLVGVGHNKGQGVLVGNGVDVASVQTIVASTVAVGNDAAFGASNVDPKFGSSDSGTR